MVGVLTKGYTWQKANENQFFESSGSRSPPASSVAILEDVGLTMKSYKNHEHETPIIERLQEEGNEERSDSRSKFQSDPF